MAEVVKEEEKVVFIGELDKMRDEYRKCRDLSLRLQIEEDIELLQKSHHHLRKRIGRIFQ
nr:hypothetical protein [Planococcus salinarum]